MGRAVPEALGSGIALVLGLPLAVTVKLALPLELLVADGLCDALKLPLPLELLLLEGVEAALLVMLPLWVRDTLGVTADVALPVLLTVTEGVGAEVKLEVGPAVPVLEMEGVGATVLLTVGGGVSEMVAEALSVGVELEEGVRGTGRHSSSTPKGRYGPRPGVRGFRRHVALTLLHRPPLQLAGKLHTGEPVMEYNDPSAGCPPQLRRKSLKTNPLIWRQVAAGTGWKGHAARNEDAVRQEQTSIA